MPKRWSIQLTLQTLDDAGNVTEEKERFTEFSFPYPDDKEGEVRKKKDNIEKKAKQEK